MIYKVFCKKFSTFCWELFLYLADLPMDSEEQNVV